MPSQATKTKALDALENMRQIVRREMVVKGVYVEEEVSSPNLTKAICGGRKHCAIGSLWIGSGVRPRIDRYDDSFVDISLPGTAEDERPGFLRHRPGLRLAYDSLNTAARSFIDRHGIAVDNNDGDPYAAPIEALFEGHYGEELTKRDLLAIISAAKRGVTKA